MEVQALVTPTSTREPENTSFASEMAAEEEGYAALMAQAKISLARIKELGVEIDKVRESQNTGEIQATELLSRIGSLGGAVRGGEIDESEDHTMEENHEVEATDQMEEEYHMEDSKMEDKMEVEMVEDGSFPELMERAKRLLARVTMNGNDQKTGDEVEAQARHERAYADLWNPM